MTNEIKEILDNIKNKYEDYYVQDIVSGNDLKLLLDYITNLQDKLKWYENIDPNKTIDKFRLEQNMKVKNLHQRIDKAVEYIKWNLNKNEELIEYFNYDANFNELLNILRGDE